MWLTLSLLGLLLLPRGVRLQRVAAAVQGVVAVLVVQDAGEADLPLVAMAAQLWVQAQPAAVQVLKHTVLTYQYSTVSGANTGNIKRRGSGLTTSGSVRGRGKQGNVSRRKVVISSSSWQAAIFRAKGQPHFVGFTVSDETKNMVSK